MENRVMNLEMKVAFLEDTVNQLDRVICDQRSVIDALKKQYQLLNQKQEELLTRLDDQPMSQEIPPHY